MEDADLDFFVEEYEKEILSPEGDYSEILVLDLDEDTTDYEHNGGDAGDAERCGSPESNDKCDETSEKRTSDKYMRCEKEEHPQTSDGNLQFHCGPSLIAPCQRLPESHRLNVLRAPNTDDTFVTDAVNYLDGDAPSSKKRRTTSNSENDVVTLDEVGLVSPLQLQAAESHCVNGSEKVALETGHATIKASPVDDSGNFADNTHAQKNRFESSPELDLQYMSNTLGTTVNESSWLLSQRSVNSRSPSQQSRKNMSHSHESLNSRSPFQNCLNNRLPSQQSSNINVKNLTGDVSDVLRKKEVSLLLHRKILSKFDSVTESIRPHQQVSGNIPNIIHEINESGAFPKSTESSQVLVEHTVTPSKKHQSPDEEPDQQLKCLKMASTMNNIIKETAEIADVVDISHDSDCEITDSTVLAGSRDVSSDESVSPVNKGNLLKQYVHGYLLGLQYKAVKNCQKK